LQDLNASLCRKYYFGIIEIVFIDPVLLLLKLVNVASEYNFNRYKFKNINFASQFNKATFFNVILIILFYA